MKVEVREDSVHISGYVNAVERLSKPISMKSNGVVRTFLERIKAGVFRSALKRNGNVLVLLNHDQNRMLASTEDGNAILDEDNIGLRADITITDKEVVQKAREGKLSGWSFGFIVNDDEETSERNNPYPIRTVTDMELLEVSILDDTKSPAYYGTSIETREGGAKAVEIRTEDFVGESNEPKISIEELAEMVASKVIEALKVEEKAEETPEETPEEEQTEEPVTEEQTEEPVEEDKPEENNESQEAEKPEEEERAIDYSSFESRFAKLSK